MKKTALQQAIEQAENHQGIVTRHFWIEILKSLLPTEREQIENAFEKGGEDIGRCVFGGASQYTDGSNYFTKTYDNEKG